MSLTNALNNAISGLRATQVGVQWTSQNVGNADTPGYTRKVVNLESNPSGGVNVASVTREVNASLAREALREQNTLAGLETSSEYMSRLSEFLGNPNEGGRLTRNISELAEAFEELALAPRTLENLTLTRDRGRDAANELRALSDEIQDLRTQATQQVATSISVINDALVEIDDLNGTIGQRIAIGDPAGDLQDQRDLAVERIANEIPIEVRENSLGQFSIFLKTGQSILDGAPRLLAEQVQISQVTAVMEFPALTDVTFANDPTSDLTSALTSGRLGEAITLRDEVLPTYQTQIDSLAIELRDAMNLVHNRGTPSPPPETVTARTSYHENTRFSFTDSTRLIVFDSDGEQVGYADYSTLGVAKNTSEIAADLNLLTDISNGTDVAQVDVVDTVPLTTGQTATFTIGAITVTYTAAGRETAEQARDGLLALINADTALNSQVVASEGTNANEIVITSILPGTDFVATTGGSGTGDGVALTNVTLNVPPVAQVDTITMGAIATGQTATISVGGFEVTIDDNGGAGRTATEARDAAVLAILADPDLSALVTAANGGAVDELTLTAVEAGTPFTTVVGGVALPVAATTTPNTVPIAQVDSIDLDYLAPGQTLTYSIGAVSVIYTAGPDGATPTEARDGLIEVINGNPFLAARVVATEGTGDTITLTAAVPGNAFTGTIVAAPATIGIQTTQEAVAAPSLGLTATVTDGQLSISVAEGYGLAMLDVPADGSRDVAIDVFADGVFQTDQVQGFSNLFGFNDFYETTPGGPVQASVLFSTTSQPVEANFQIVTPVGRTTISGDRSLSEIVQQINATPNLDINASLYRFGTQWGIRLSGSDQIAVQNLTGNQVTFARQELGAAQSIELIEEIENRPELIARGRPITTPPQNDTYRLETADGAIAGQMAAIFSEAREFPAVAGLPLVSTTFSQYSAQIAGQIGEQAAEVQADYEFQVDFTALLQQRIASESAVDIDEELAELIQLQNAYAASARVIDTVTQLFDILNNTAR